MRLISCTFLQSPTRPRELPAALGNPVDQGAQDDDAEHQPEQVGIERNLEQIEGERIAEDRIAPGSGGAAQIAAAEVANDGPGVERGKRRSTRAMQKDSERR